MRAAAAAAAAGTALQGLFAVYKPPGIHWRAVRDTVERHLIKGLNSLQRPEPRQQICFQPTVSEKETGKELTLTAYTVTGLFGKATDDFSDAGKLIEKSTFDHVTREKLERIVSVIQGSNHKALLQPPPSRGFLPRRHYSPPKESEEPEIEEPLCFTKSPANPRRWTTRQSMGSDHQQPLWRAMLISLTMLAILLWCYLRPETEADRRAEEFLQFLQILPQQELPPPVPSGEDEKKP
ncbi:hypothetical protein E2320_006492 [Naja naja]|nr:hypothetical protein E2320_006492 [Naja naja]